MKKSEMGRIGEELVSKHLIINGYEVLLKNYRKKFGEIDILAKATDGTLIFIEVKTIGINEVGILKPEDNFTPQKYRKVKRMAEFFAAQHPELIDEEMGWRIDLVAVEISLNGAFTIRHYENI